MGIGHFAESKDKKEWLCPTPKGSVPWEILSNIKFPTGVNAWRFGKGNGKGKGKGKGGRGGGRGRGRYEGSAYETEVVTDSVLEMDIEDDTAGWEYIFSPISPPKWRRRRRRRRNVDAVDGEFNNRKKLKNMN